MWYSCNFIACKAGISFTKPARADHKGASASEQMRRSIQGPGGCRSQFITRSWLVLARGKISVLKGTWWGSSLSVAQESAHMLNLLVSNKELWNWSLCPLHYLLTWSLWAQFSSGNYYQVLCKGRWGSDDLNYLFFFKKAKHNGSTV